MIRKQTIINLVDLMSRLAGREISVEMSLKHLKGTIKGIKVGTRGALKVSFTPLQKKEG